MNYFLLIFLLLQSTFALADEDKAIISRGEDKLAKVMVNVGGTLTEAASFGDPANCATSGALVCSGIYLPVVNATAGTSGSPQGFKYFRIMNMVHVSGRISSAITDGSSVYDATITLPITSTFASSYDLTGVVGWSGAAGTFRNGYLFGQGINARVQITLLSGPTDTFTPRVEFTYEIK